MSLTIDIASKMAPVVDVSIAAKCFLPDERSSASAALLDRVLKEGAYVLALFRWEMQSVSYRRRTCRPYRPGRR